MTGDKEVILTDNIKKVDAGEGIEVTLTQILYLPSGVMGGWVTEANSIDPTSVISTDSELIGDIEVGPGVVISSRSRMKGEVNIGKNAKIFGSTITGGEGGITIGEHAQISGSILKGSGLVISGEDYMTIIRKSNLAGDFLVNPECNLNKIQVEGKFLIEDGTTYAGGVYIDGGDAANFIVPQDLPAGLYRMNELGNLVEVGDEG